MGMNDPINYGGRKGGGLDLVTINHFEHIRLNSKSVRTLGAVMMIGGVGEKEHCVFTLYSSTPIMALWLVWLI